MAKKPMPAGSMKAVETLSGQKFGSITAHNEKLQRLGKQVAKLVLIDEPLPASMLTRYLTTVSLAGIDTSVGREQIDWVNTGLRAIRLEHELKKSDDPDKKDKDFSHLEKMFEGADILNEIAAEEDDGEEEE